MGLILLGKMPLWGQRLLLAHLWPLNIFYIVCHNCQAVKLIYLCHAAKNYWSSQVAPDNHTIKIFTWPLNNIMLSSISSKLFNLNAFSIWEITTCCNLAECFLKYNGYPQIVSFFFQELYLAFILRTGLDIGFKDWTVSFLKHENRFLSNAIRTPAIRR